MAWYKFCIIFCKIVAGTAKFLLGTFPVRMFLTQSWAPVITINDGVIAWKWASHQWPFVRGIHRPEWNGQCFENDIFKCISLDKDINILIEILLRFVSYCLIGLHWLGQRLGAEQMTSHYPNSRWLRPLTPYDATELHILAWLHHAIHYSNMDAWRSRCFSISILTLCSLPCVTVRRYIQCP